MTEHKATPHRAKPETWAFVEECAPRYSFESCLLELHDRVEALEAGLTTVSLELRDRVEALEASDTNRSDHIGEANKMVPDGPLVERVAYAITGDDDGPINWKNEARAAIHEVAAWLRSKTDLVCGPQCARWLEQQLDKPS